MPKVSFFLIEYMRNLLYQVSESTPRLNQLGRIDQGESFSQGTDMRFDGISSDIATGIINLFNQLFVRENPSAAARHIFEQIVFVRCERYFLTFVVNIAGYRMDFDTFDINYRIFYSITPS